MILFAVLFSVYLIFWLIPGYLTYQKYLLNGFIIETRGVLNSIILIAETLSIYLLSCIIISVKNKIKKK